GTSSLFAFLKVAKPTDKADKPYITLSVLTSNGEREEPINELQRQFDLSYACSTVNVKEEVENALYPNPTSGIISFSIPQKDVKLHDAKGNLIMNLKGPLQTIDCSGLANGVYSMHTQTLKGSVIIHK
ncbi:MAG: T9SS type A sorting domain-containing protein, partial [Ignavibacteria bacterium]